MKEKKQTAPAVNLFSKDNYIWMIAGVVLVAIGIILMSGGKSTDPNVFKENEVYSVRRITIAPIIILLGLGIEVYAIFKKPKNS
jgi:NhaP-type Na+/H+ or K+/H+ antiporter